MKKIILTALYISLAATALTGCYDKVELENRGFVISIGMDKPEKDERISISTSYPNVAALASRSGDGESKTVKEASGETVSSALNKIDSYTSKRTDFGNTKLCVISGEVLSDGELLRESLDALERNNQISKRLIVMSTDKKAADILKAKVEGEPMVGLFVDSFYKNNTSGIKNDLERMVRSLRFSGNALIPKITLEDEEIRISGVAVIKDFELVGFADEEELRGYLWIKEKAEQVTADYNGVKLPLKINRVKCRQSFLYDGEKLTCVLLIKAEGDIEEYKFFDETLFSSEIFHDLSEVYENMIYEEVMRSWRLFYKEYKTDVLELKDSLRKKDYGLYKKLEPDFEEVLENIEVEVAVEVKVRNTGAVK